MEWFGGHAHQCHDFQELLLARLTQLLYIIPSLLDEGLVVREEVGTLQDPVQLQLTQCPRQRHGWGTCPEEEGQERGSEYECPAGVPTHTNTALFPGRCPPTPRSTEGRCPIYSYQENAYLIFYFDLSGLGQHNLEH